MRLHIMLAALGILPAAVLAASSSCVADQSSSSGIPLISSQINNAVLVTDPASPATIHRLAASFAKDIQAVVPSSSGTIINASSISSLDWSNSASQSWVFIGGIDSSALLNEVANATSTDMSSLRGQWEAYSVSTPTLAVGQQSKQVIMIAGSDRVSQ